MTNKQRVTLTLEAYANAAFESEDAIVDGLCSAGVERLESERLVALVPLAFGRALISHMGEFDFPKSAILTAQDGSLKLCDLAADALYRCAVEEAASMFHQGPRHLFQPAASASAEVQVLSQFLDSKADADLAGIRFIEPQFLRVTYEEWTRSGGVGTKRVTAPFRFIRRTAGALLVAVGSLLFALGLSESWSTALSPDPQRIASYHFGSEAMLGHGGWSYANPEVYGWTSLVSLGLVGIAVALVGVSLIRASWRAAIAGAVIGLVVTVAMQYLGHLEWERRATSRPSEVQP